jgi:hypothetical protein
MSALWVRFLADLSETASSELGHSRRDRLVRFGGDAAIGRPADGRSVPIAAVSTRSKVS